MAEGVFRTRDLSLAAYVQMVGGESGVRLIKANRTGRDKFEFLFSDPEGKGDEIHVQFINSECHTYDSNVRAMKKLVFGRGNGRDSREKESGE